MPATAFNGSPVLAKSHREACQTGFPRSCVRPLTLRTARTTASQRIGCGAFLVRRCVVSTVDPGFIKGKGDTIAIAPRARWFLGTVAI